MAALVFLLVPSASVHSQETSAIVGRVTDARGLPVQGATLHLEPTGFWTETDATGRFRIEGVRPGRFQLVAEAAGRRRRAVGVRIAREGETTRVDLVLGQAGPIELAEVVTFVDPAAEVPLRRVVRREQIVRAGSVARALARLPGVFVKEFGAGGAQEVSLRGGSPEQTLVLWGEQPLSGPGGGSVDLSALPVGAIDSIEVVPRGASSRYGPGAVAGVIRIHPALPAGEAGPDVEVGAEAGSLGERSGSARAGLGAGPVALSIAVEGRGYERAFGRGPGSGGEQWDAALSARAPASALGLSVLLHDSDRGAPGPVANPTPRARVANERALASISHTTDVGSWALRSEVALQSSSVEYADPERPAAASRSRETSLAMRLRGAGALGRHQPEAGLEVRRDALEATGVAGRPRRGELGVHAGDRWRPGNGRLALAAGVRLDLLSTSGSAPEEAQSDSQALAPAPEAATRHRSVFLSPSLAASFDLGSGLALGAYAGRAVRAPGFQSLFFVSGVGVRGNPALREERSRDIELGLAWERGPLSTTATGFDRRLDGAIVWLPDFRFIWSPRNLPGAVVRGVELAASWREGSWEASASYTYAPARFDFPGNRNPLPYRPAHLGHAELTYDTGRFRASLEARLTGLRYPNLAGTNPLAAFVTVDVTAAHAWTVQGGELELELRLENLKDERFEVVAGFPAAGRTARVALHYRGGAATRSTWP